MGEELSHDHRTWHVQVHIDPVLRRTAYGDGFMSRYQTLDYEHPTSGIQSYETIKMLFDQILKELQSLMESE